MDECGRGRDELLVSVGKNRGAAGFRAFIFYLCLKETARP